MDKWIHSTRKLVATAKDKGMKAIGAIGSQVAIQSRSVDRRGSVSLLLLVLDYSLGIGVIQ